MIILFQNVLFLKEFLACNYCFGLFTKIKEGSGTSFWHIISAWFFHKNVSYLILYLWSKFQYHTFFPSQEINQNALFRQLMTSWTLRFIFNHPVRQWLTGRKTMTNIFHLYICIFEFTAKLLKIQIYDLQIIVTCC